MSATEAQSTRVHPRRRPVIKDALPSLMTDSSPESSKMPLKKGETFHTPTTPLAGKDPALEVRSLPRRSPTSLDSIAASEQHMASILERLTLDDTPEKSEPAKEEPPVSRGVSKAHNEANPPFSAISRRSSMDSARLPPFWDKKVRHDSGHESDSGLGTSVSSCDVQSTASDSKATFDLGSSPRRLLPPTACKQIERYILIPLLKEEELKPFHSLVRTVPSRIVKKQIVCLRDLERILLCLAPKYAPTRSSYLYFSEYTIQCLHTSVTRLNDRDQRLPTERPYTNGYFLDLVSQVQRYAAMIRSAYHEAKSAQSYKDSSTPIMFIKPTIQVQGGLSINGQPTELVAMQDGNRIPLAPGVPYSYNNPIATKRTLDSYAPMFDDESVEVEADEGVKRSMARRKKNAPPMDINQKCDMCDRVFKRYCDLTKHEKTHTRPWKCRVKSTNCKYIHLGWPTEKERDRHENDKHSTSPTLFKCTFKPCTYASKRESNCKQHMEKAHGWFYLRSKNNARGGSKRGSPQSTTPSASDFSTPASKPMDSPSPIFNFNDPVFPTLGNDFALFGGSPMSSTGLDGLQAQFAEADPQGLIPEFNLISGSTVTGEDASPASYNTGDLGINWDGIDFEAEDPMPVQLPMYPYGYEKMGQSEYQDPGMNMYFGDHGLDGQFNDAHLDPPTGFYPGAHDATLFSAQ